MWCAYRQPSSPCTQSRCSTSCPACGQCTMRRSERSSPVRLLSSTCWADSGRKGGGSCTLTSSAPAGWGMLPTPGRSSHSAGSAASSSGRAPGSRHTRLNCREGAEEAGRGGAQACCTFLVWWVHSESTHCVSYTQVGVRSLPVVKGSLHPSLGRRPGSHDPLAITACLNEVHCHPSLLTAACAASMLGASRQTASCSASSSGLVPGAA